jgi:hypothetical protein
LKVFKTPVAILLCLIPTFALAASAGQAVRETEKSPVSATSDSSNVGSGSEEANSGFLGKFVRSLNVQQGSSNGSSKHLKETPLYQIFKKFPVTDTNNPPEYPKVAISISYPSWLNDGDATLGRFKNNPCLNYSITFWSSAKLSQKYDDLTVCASEMAKVSHNGLRTIWPNFSVSGENTGQVRTYGPVPPAFPFPTDGTSKNFMMYGGVFFLGAILNNLGYDWEFPQDKRRVWVVRVGDISQPNVANEKLNVDANSSPTIGNNRILAKCQSEFFNEETFRKISLGMNLQQVNETLGCAPDTSLTQRSQRSVLYVWLVSTRTEVAAKSISVFFDPSTEKVKGLGKEFKSSTGF